MQRILKNCFSDPLLNVMNFLNEVVLEFPKAISFAPGRPLESLFNVEESLGAIQSFVDYQIKVNNLSRAMVFGDLGQYNRTNGIINEFITRQLANDENIQIQPKAVIITSGCQEAMATLLMGLFDPAKDVLLASDPTYIGITGLAKLLGISVIPISVTEEGLEVRAVTRAINEVLATGKRPKALYVIPDFNNPLGTSMTMEVRNEILQIAYKNGLLIFEDNPYGMFAYDEKRKPTLKALDEHGVVIYLNSFSKTLFPGLRLGFLVADQQVDNSKYLLAEELSKVKSLTTINTSPLLQALVGGLLLESNYSLLPIVEAKLSFYRTNRDFMLNRLAEEFGSNGLDGAVKWTCPAGGFFLTVTLPFEFDAECLRVCAADYGVVCCPMSFFCLSRGREHQIRLSFSYVTKEEIDRGIRQLNRFVQAQIAQNRLA
ncbi:MAG: PLP-dependent aminotransferase family protein [Fischerella sp. CENA71]|nr:PLP-dependent aminotransferase family protein [Fischerella sp. CENA71]